MRGFATRIRTGIARCFAALAVLFAAATLQGCADFLVRVSTHPPYHGNSIRHECRRWEKRVPGITAWIDSLRTAGALKDTFVVADDGVKLHAYYMDAAAPSLRTAIVVHGFIVNQMNVMMLARMYRDSLGYNVLLPALRHHGKSGGKEVQFGWKDRLDLLRWAEVAHGIFADTLQVFHGESMGAATVMMASGEQTPPYVRGFIEDCGYTSVWDIMTHCQEHLLHLKAEPTLSRASEKCRRRYGWDWREASSVNQLAKCSKPMLFIHGNADPLVPVWMAQTCYDAKVVGYRELWIA
nr:alpha/beta hydrolase [Bacteroidales bacterium]